MKLERQINFKYTATDATGAATRSAEQNFQRLGSLAKTYAPVIAGVFSVATLAKATDLFVRQEQAIFQLEQRLKSTGGVVGYSSQQLQDMASSLQGLTTFGDEATIEMEALLLTFTNIRGTIFEQSLPAILDMSTAMDQDLKSSAIQVGKALNNPIEGISALTRVGVTFTDAQKEQIRTLQESGRMAEAQAIILRELKTEFGGAAEAARQGLGGSLKSLSNSFGDTLEKIGSGGTGFIGSVQHLEAVITSEKFLSGLNAIARGIIWVGDVAAKVTAQIGEAVDAWSDEATARVRQIVDKEAELRNELARLPRDGIAGMFLSVRKGQIEEELALLAEEYQMLVKLAAFNAKSVTTGAPSGSPVVTPAALVKMDRKEWDAVLGQQEIDDAVAAIGNFQAQLRVRLAEAPAPSLGFAGFDIASHMAGRPEETGTDDTAIRAAERYSILQQSFMSETELVQSTYWQQASIIDEAHQAGLISEMERSVAMSQIWAERERGLTTIVDEEETRRAEKRRDIAMGTAKTLLSIGSSLQAASAGQSRKMFEVSKVASIAGTVVSTYQAAQDSFTAMAKIPVVGPALGAAAAAAALIAGFARVRAIESTNFGGSGGGVPAGSSTSYGNFSGGSPPVVTQPLPTQQNQGPQEITIHLVGGVTDAYIEEEIIPRINSAASRSVRIEFTRG